MLNKKFLEQLYYGNVSPMERNLVKDSKVSKLLKIVGDASNEFRDKLSVELSSEYDKVCALETTKSCELELEAFIYGCRFMYRLLTSCMGDESRDFVIEPDVKV